MKQLNTVNVIKMDSVNTTIINIRSWPDTPEGNKVAERYFCKLLDKSDRANKNYFLDEGFYEDLSCPRTVFLIHSGT